MCSSELGLIRSVIPKPVETIPSNEAYEITDETTITLYESNVSPIAELLADYIRSSTRFNPSIQETGYVGGQIELVLKGAPSEVGTEGYELTVAEDGVTIRANASAGLFMRIQTLRQLIPPAVENNAPEDRQWIIPGGRILDYPRFSYRGVHLDVARHFFDIDDIKQYIEYAVRDKCNHLHLHLTDDQGWRIEIEGWPKLTEIGAGTEVNGGEGGYYTQQEYADLVTYAQKRFVTVVPEVDIPGHTNAALASYAELNPDGERSEPYTGTEVGFSTLAINNETTYKFLDDVFGQLSELTPGPYLHLGGDEVQELANEEYAIFIEKIASIIRDHGKRPMGWHDIISADLPECAIIQYWATTSHTSNVDRLIEFCKKHIDRSILSNIFKYIYWK